MELPLGGLLAEAELPPTVRCGDGSEMMTGVVFDSREVREGSLFCCLRGATADGHAFAASAVAAGARALVVDHELPLDIAQVVVPDTREAMGHLAAAYFGHPSRNLTLVGITGTNGKTTTTSLLAAILESAGIAVGIIGTLTGKHTTPEAPHLQALLAGFVAGGKTVVVMEVSSHALALHRVAGCRFALVVFTNLGRDHLDLHGTQEDYFAAKATLFEPGLAERGIANADDVHGRLLIDAQPIPIEAFSASDFSDLTVTPTDHEYNWRGQRIHVGLGGAFNSMNSLAAATAAAALGVPPAAISVGLQAARPVPGRFEPVDAGQPFTVIVDFAHTPDGLREVLGAARAASGDGRVIAVFGCGGDRDREKRPMMGAVAAELADFVIVTSDNPRSEDPLVIINAVIAGVAGDYRDRVVSEPDRRRAFAAAFRKANPGDLVVIAGKGHETTQTVGVELIPFEDRAVALSLLENPT